MYFILEFMMKIPRGGGLQNEKQGRIITADGRASAEALGHRYVAVVAKNTPSSQPVYLDVREYPA
jgi:hypothetical protein